MKLILPFILFMLLAGCSIPSDDEYTSDITLKTVDGVNIKATLYDNPSGMGIILLHELGKDRNVWNKLASELQKNYKVISIDLRGHGESDLDWRDFSEEDFNDIELDVAAAKDELGVKKIAIIGASIGANIALNYAVNDSEVKAVILLSPGLDYKGVSIKKSILDCQKPMLVFTAEEDSYSYESGNALSKISGFVELKAYPGKEHGVEILNKNVDAKEIISFWLKQKMG